MNVRISERLENILGYAREEAMRTGCRAITPDHLALGILRDGDNDACRAMAALGVEPDRLKSHIDGRICSGSYIPYSESPHIAISRNAGNAINLAAFEALKAGQEEVIPAHLLLGLCRTEGWEGKALFDLAGITPESLGEYLKEHGMHVSTIRTVTPSPEDISGLIRIPGIGSNIPS